MVGFFFIFFLPPRTTTQRKANSRMYIPKRGTSYDHHKQRHQCCFQCNRGFFGYLDCEEKYYCMKCEIYICDECAFKHFEIGGICITPLQPPSPHCWLDG
jgi:hypothetical protein